MALPQRCLLKEVLAQEKVILPVASLHFLTSIYIVVANPFAPGGGSGIVGAPSTTSTSQGVKLEKSHSYQTVLNSTKEPEVKGNITKIRSGSFSRATANNNKSSSASDLMIQENAEKTTTEKSKMKGEPPTVPSKKRLALLHSFNK